MVTLDGITSLLRLCRKSFRSVKQANLHVQRWTFHLMRLITNKGMLDAGLHVYNISRARLCVLRFNSDLSC